MFVNEVLHNGQLEDTLAHCRMQGKQNESTAHTVKDTHNVDMTADTRGHDSRLMVARQHDLGRIGQQTHID